MIPKWSSDRFPRQTGVSQSGFPDRLGQSLSHLLSIVNALKEKQVAFRSLTEGMDTTTASGELLFHVFGALAQYERALTKDRVQSGPCAPTSPSSGPR